MIFFSSHRVGEIILFSILVRVGKATEDTTQGLCVPKHVFFTFSSYTVEQKLFLLTHFP